MSPVFAIVPAAGSSTRMGGGVSKALLSIGGRTVLERSIDALLAAAPVDKIIVLCREADRAAIAALAFPRETVQIEIGGATRQLSVRRGLEALQRAVPAETLRRALVMVHDAARCLVAPAGIAACLAQARETGAAVLAAPVADTLKRAGAEGVIVETVPRDDIWAVQTPQIFQFELLWRAHVEATGDGATDDAGMVERLAPVRLVAGSRQNIKITTPEDVLLAENLLRR